MRLPRLRKPLRQINWTKVAFFGAASIVALMLGAWIVIAGMARGQIVELSSSPTAEVAIVPGARVGSSGRPSLALRQRLDGAADLFESGSVSHILVSGDNGQEQYNEPVAMQQYLRGLGIPSEAITLDYAGFDTWDTCIRAKEQFGVGDALVVTQPRHAERTAALCQRAGIDTTVTTTADYAFRTSTQVQADVRERLAVVKALGDIIGTPTAHHGGPFVGLIGSDDNNL